MNQISAEHYMHVGEDDEFHSTVLKEQLYSPNLLGLVGLVLVHCSLILEKMMI